METLVKHYLHKIDKPVEVDEFISFVNEDISKHTFVKVDKFELKYNIINSNYPFKIGKEINGKTYFSFRLHKGLKPEEDVFQKRIAILEKIVITVLSELKKSKKPLTTSEIIKILNTKYNLKTNETELDSFIFNGTLNKYISKRVNGDIELNMIPDYLEKLLISEYDSNTESDTDKNEENNFITADNGDIFYLIKKYKYYKTKVDEIKLDRTKNHEEKSTLIHEPNTKIKKTEDLIINYFNTNPEQLSDFRNDISSFFYRRIFTIISKHNISENKNDNLIKTKDQEVVEVSKSIEKRIIDLINKRYSNFQVVNLIYIEYKKKLNFNQIEKIRIDYKSLNKFKVELDSFSIDQNKKDKEIKGPSKTLLEKETLTNGNDIINFLVSKAKSTFINIDSGDEKFDHLICTIIKHNKITKCDEKFLKQKIKELELSEDVISKVKESLRFNNHYLDELIQIILDGDVISKEELSFLNDKVEENQFNEEHVNLRFWEIAINFHFKNLRKYQGFDRVIKLWYHVFLIEKDIKPIMNLFNSMNIFFSLDFNEILNKGIEMIEYKYSPAIRKHNQVKTIDELFDKITFEEKEELCETNIKYDIYLNDTLSKETNHVDLKINNIKINNKLFIVNEKSYPFAPLINLNINNSTGDYEIIINSNHKLYTKECRKSLVEIACSMYYTKLSMTDPNISRFIQRINDNLELIEHE